MNKMNFNSKKETADKKERQGADDATKLQDEQVNAAEENATSDNVTDEGPEQKELEELKKKYDELNDSHLRLMAEFDNYRKRTDKEKSAMYEIGARDVIEKILPVVDNFERGLATVPEESKEDPFVDGMNRIYKQLMTELENIGVKPIEAVGQEFDPNLHNAVMQVESDEYESGVIAQELQKGYTYHDMVVRHSMVGVVQ